jgi:hypothetical protein
METVLWSASITGSMICPKCGYAQEDRLDCKRCGIVFSKYCALVPTIKSAAANGLEKSIAPGPSEQDLRAMISNLQLQVRELSARSAQVEFETSMTVVPCG